MCSLRLDFESFTTAGPTKTDDSVACIDSFQVTAVSCEISIFIQKFVKWIFRKILQNYPNLWCLLYIAFIYVFTETSHHFFTKIMWNHNIWEWFLWFSTLFFISSNDLTEKTVNWKLRNFAATLFSQFSVKSTFYFEIDLTKKVSIQNYGILLPHCFRKFPSN